MSRFLSLRPFTLFLAAVGILVLATGAQAVERHFASRGTAEFVTLEDFVGSGTATHLGLYDEEGTATFTPTADPAVLHVDANATYRAANGDELFASFSGELNLLTGVITATVTYEGGTGRFTNATGTASLSGQMFPDNTIQVAVQGTIDF